MRLTPEPLMQAQCDKAADEALGDFVVVLGSGNGPVLQHRFRAEFDDGFFDIQAYLRPLANGGFGLNTCH